MSKQKYPNTSNINASGVPVKKGRESYNSTVLHAKRDKRRLEADARQREYNKLTVAQKIERATKRGGSVRELARLNKAVKASKKS